MSDILVAVPMIIKGIELMIVYPMTNEEMVWTLSITGKNYGAYERRFTECYPTVGTTQTVGTVLISIALWDVLVVRMQSLHSRERFNISTDD